MSNIATPAGFIASAGNWAAQQFQRQLTREGVITTECLRANDSLPKDVWKHFDDTVIEEHAIRLRAVADLLANPSLVLPIDDALGVTIIEFDRVGEMNPAERSMSGQTRSALDTVDFDQDGVPNFITHKDFSIDIRRLAASRRRGEPLDSLKPRVAARLVAESLEDALLNGSGVTSGSRTGYGYRNHPSRNTASFEATGAAWHNTAKTGAQIVADVGTMMAALEGDRYSSGPYAIYVPSNVSGKLNEDHKAGTMDTIRERVLRMDGIQSIQVCDQLPSACVVMVQLTPDVVQLANGEEVHTVQWDAAGGFRQEFKVLAIQVPIVKSTHDGRCGVVHMT